MVESLVMSRLLQIYESDLAELEHTLPELAGAMMGQLDNRRRVQWRRVQQILSDVRWNYGPPTHVEAIPANGEEPPPLTAP